MMNTHHAPFLRVSQCTLRLCVIFSLRPSRIKDMEHARQKKGQQITPAPAASIRYVVTSLRHYFSPSAIAALGVAHAAAGHIILDPAQTLP